MLTCHHATGDVAPNLHRVSGLAIGVPRRAPRLPTVRRAHFAAIGAVAGLQPLGAALWAAVTGLRRSLKSPVFALLLQASPLAERMLAPRTQQHVERLADQRLHGGVFLDREHAELAAHIPAGISDTTRAGTGGTGQDKNFSSYPPNA